jgi:hypothetical protein
MSAATRPRIKPGAIVGPLSKPPVSVLTQATGKYRDFRPDPVTGKPRSGTTS